MKDLISDCYCWKALTKTLKTAGFSQRAINRLGWTYPAAGYDLNSVRVLSNGKVIVGFYEGSKLQYDLYSGKSFRICRLKRIKA
jgi:hypothetical protein